MSAFLTPEKNPFFARMYFSPQVFAGLLEFFDAVTEQIPAVFCILTEVRIWIQKVPLKTFPYITEYHDLMCIFGIVQRTDTFGKQIDCDDFMIHIFDNSYKHIMIDVFTAAVGYELLNNVLPKAEQLAKDYINMEEKNADFLMNTIDMRNKLLFDSLHVPDFVLYYI